MLRAGRRSEILQPVYFPFRQWPKFPGRDIKSERAKLHSLDLFHQKAHLQEHAANLAIAAFDQRDFIQGFSTS